MRLVTRDDFDGICCAALLRELGVVDEIHYATPNDIQAGKVPITQNDVLANVPFIEGCGLWFDHHMSEAERLKIEGNYKGLSTKSPSAARVIYDFYEGPQRLNRFNEMMKYVDIVDSASFGEDDVLNPQGWILLGFLCDPRSGLDRVSGFSISNEQFVQDIVEHIRNHNIHEILNLPDIMERTEMYFQMHSFCKDFLMTYSRVDGPVVITDTRGFEEIPPGNRFLIYSLFPKASISIAIIEEDDGSVTFSVGHSVMNRTSKVNVGSMLLRHGGGGHARVGSCQVPGNKANEVLKLLIAEIKASS